MGKLIWILIAAAWLCLALISNFVLIKETTPVSESLDFTITILGILLVVGLVISTWSLLARGLVWSLRAPILVALFALALLSQLLMKIEHLTVRLGHWLIPSTNQKRWQ